MNLRRITLPTAIETPTGECTSLNQFKDRSGCVKRDDNPWKGMDNPCRTWVLRIHNGIGAPPQLQEQRSNHTTEHHINPTILRTHVERFWDPENWPTHTFSPCVHGDY